jgi:sulfoxide reductase heme-binding subunit YedZ
MKLRPSVLWRDRSGRFWPLKALVLVAVLVPGVWLAVRWSLFGLGARPLNTAIHFVGLWGLRLLLISLVITPARGIFGLLKLVQLRRMLGLAAATYLGAHFVLYCVDQQFQIVHIAHEILRRQYLTIGFVTLCGVAVLAATSTDAMVRRLRRNWKRLHRLVYPLAVLGLLHAFMQAKLDVSQPAILAGLFSWEMLYRTLPNPLQASPWALFLLAPLAALATAIEEAGWYGLAKHIPWQRVLEANLMIHTLGLRPAGWVGVVTLAVAVLAVGRHLARRIRPPSSPAPAPVVAGG